MQYVELTKQLVEQWFIFIAAALWEGSEKQYRLGNASDTGFFA